MSEVSVQARPPEVDVRSKAIVVARSCCVAIAGRVQVNCRLTVD